MFTRIKQKEMIREKQVHNLLKTIETVKVKIEKIDKDIQESIEFENMDKYQKLMTEKMNLEEFITRTKKTIVEIKQNVSYKKEDLEEIKIDILNSYNNKLKKAHSDLRKKLEVTQEAFESYETLTKEFIETRDEFNKLNSAIGAAINVYEGENKIKNDDYKIYENINESIKEALKNNIVE